MTYEEAKPQLQLGSNGACSDAKLMPIVSNAQAALMTRGYFVGMFGELKIQTANGNFSLPYGYQRAVNAIQNMEDGSISQVWCSIENDNAFMQPEQWGDGELIDLGDGPLERDLFTPSILAVRPDAIEDEGITISVEGLTNQGNQTVYNDSLVEQIPIVNQQYWDGAVVYGTVLTVKKPRTNGPVRLYAYQGATRYLVCTMQPEETIIKRRRYRYPEVVLQPIPVSTVTYDVDHVVIDTGRPQVNLCEGQTVYITGFCPGYINGLWTVASVSGGTFTINGSFSGVEGAITEIYGSITVNACLNVTALKRPQIIVDPDQELIIQNILALQLAVFAQFKWNAENLEEYSALLDQATKLLTDETARYGQDPTKALNRRANYRYDISRYPHGSLGNFRGRLALELPGGEHTGKRDLSRLINEAMEYFISLGKYGQTVREKQYTVNENSAIVLESDENSLLTASICNIPLVIEDNYYPSSRPNGGLWMGTWNGYGGFYPNSAGPGIYGNVGTCTYKAIDYGPQDIYDGRRAYYITPCSVGKCVNAVVKLQYVPILQAGKIMPITNYPAVKVMVEALIAKTAKDMNTYNSLRGVAVSILDKDKGQKRGGARALPRFQMWGKRGIGYGMR